MDLIITILPVVTKDLFISPQFTPYDFLSRCKFRTLTTRQPMVEFYLLTVASALGIEPTEEEIATEMKAMATEKAVGPDGLPAELLKLELQQDRTILLEHYRLTTLIWREGKVPQQWKDAVITVLHKKGDKTECGNYRGIFARVTRG